MQYSVSAVFPEIPAGVLTTNWSRPSKGGSTA